MMNTRGELEYERELQRRIAKYKSPRKATYEEVVERIERFRGIGDPVFLDAANLMEKWLDDGTWNNLKVVSKM